jgi:phasin family protein
MFETSGDNRLIGDLNAAVANGAVESYSRAANQFNSALGFATSQTEAVSRQSAQKLEIVLEVSTILTNGFREIATEWLTLLQDRMTKNFDRMTRVASCRSFQDVAAAQSEIARDGLERSLEVTRRMREMSMRVAEQVIRISDVSKRGA